MFNFLKESRAAKFLCSACLICSLGSFVTSAEGEPTKISDVYAQGPLGFEPNHIILDGVKINTAVSPIDPRYVKSARR